MVKKNSDTTPTPRRRAAAPQRATASDPAAAPAETAGGAPMAQPSYDDIAQAAYLRYISRGGGDGQDFNDWVEAERELKQRGNGTGT